MYYPCSENKGADQLRSYCEADLRLCFRICRLLVFPCTGSFYNFSLLGIIVFTANIKVIIVLRLRSEVLKISATFNLFKRVSMSVRLKDMYAFYVSSFKEK